MKRKGYGLGKGQGYFNLVPYDSFQHSLNAKGVRKPNLSLYQKLDFFTVLNGKSVGHDFGMIPTPQKKGLIKEIARKVHEGVDWAVEWEKKHLPKQKSWVKKEFKMAKDLAERGLDKIKDKVEQKKKDLDDVRDELDHNDDGVQDISLETLTNTNLGIKQSLNTIDLDKSGVPDHLEDGTLAFEQVVDEPVMKNTDEGDGIGLPLPTLPPQETLGGEDILEPPIPSGAGFPFPTLNPKKTFGQKVKETVVGVGETAVGTVRQQIQKRGLRKDLIRALPDVELERKAIDVGKPFLGSLNIFEREIARRRKERERIAMIKRGEKVSGGGLGQTFGFLNPLSTLAQRPKQKKTDSQFNVNLGFLNPFSTLKNKEKR